MHRSRARSLRKAPDRPGCGSPRAGPARPRPGTGRTAPPGLRPALALACAAALAGAGAASAQVTGEVFGSVTDAATGVPVIGASVTLVGPALQGERATETDARGGYRISLVPPGSCALAVKAPGYRPATVPVEVALDRTVRADVALQAEVAGLAEVVVRGPPAPAVDPESAEKVLVVGQRVLGAVPVSGSDLESVALLAPTAQRDAYGISLGGATSNENAYLIDGLNVSDPGFGVLGANLHRAFLEQLEVKVGSYSAEYGRSTAGVLNAITRSGSNELRGSVFGSYSPGLLTAGGRQVSRLGEAIARSPLAGDSYQLDLGAELGGPIVRDRLWFYGGFAPVVRADADERVVSRVGPGGDAERLTARTLREVSTQYQGLAKLTGSPRGADRLSLVWLATPFDKTFHETANGTAASSERQLLGGAQALILRYEGEVTRAPLTVEAQAGWHRQRYRDLPGTVQGVEQQALPNVTWIGRRPLFDFEPVEGCEPVRDASGAVVSNPCPVDQFTSGGYGLDFDGRLDRLAARAALGGSFRLAGQHRLKGGADLERSFFDARQAFSGEEAMVFAAGQGVFLDARRFGEVANGTPVVFPSHESHSVSTSVSLFVQESWSPVDFVTLNAGLRWELQDIRRRGSSSADLSIDDNVAPRLQAIWDFTGRGRGKVAAAWGRYHEAIPLDIGSRAFGREALLGGIRLDCAPAPGAGDPGGGLATFDPRQCSPVPLGPEGEPAIFPVTTGNVQVAPGTRGQYVDQFGGGIEYEVVPGVALGVSYEGRRLGRVVEDIVALDPDGNPVSFIGNPGEGSPFVVDGATRPDGSPVIIDPQVARGVDARTGRPFETRFPRPKRRYDGVTFEVRKALSRRWLGQASYTWSSLRGNYPGLFRPELGQIDPNFTPEFDLVELLANRDGPLPADSPHQVKLFGARVWRLGRSRVTTGLGFRGASGTPVSFLGGFPGYGRSETYILPRGSAGRTPFVWSLDLRGAVERPLSGRYGLRLSVDVFNFLNRQPPTLLDQNWTFDNVYPVVGGACRAGNVAGASDPVAAALRDCPDLRYLRTIDGRPAAVNPNFGRPVRGNARLGVVPPSAYQAPLSVRLGMAITF